MLSGYRLKRICEQRNISPVQLASRIAHGGMDAEESTKAVSNWMKGFYKPRPKSSDVERIASALGVEATEISDYPACLRYAPTSPRKARLVAEMIRGRHIQDALDVLRFCHKRPSSMFSKLLKSAVANADEQQADVERLYVSEARVDGAGRRVGTKRWIPKDRGRAHPIRKEASHLHVVLAELEE